ncbi:MAG: hypothetical protein KC493_11915 [Bacteriovoracaceae bacterium]|nr:hypothetical protein [Bacteriovoracaceae bacterium]
MIKVLSLLVWITSAQAQEIDFFTTIQCEPNKKEKGMSLDISFYKKDSIIKIHEYNNKGKKEDLFPARVIKAHVFLSRRFCKFHIISRRPSADMFHFAMTVQDLTDEKMTSFEGPAHFNFLIDETAVDEKSHRRIGCKINGLKIPGYYFHSCRKRLKPTPTPRPNAPVRTTPAFDYDYTAPSGNGGASAK